jgi:hypothetical protein
VAEIYGWPRSSRSYLSLPHPPSELQSFSSRFPVRFRSASSQNPVHDTPLTPVDSLFPSFLIYAILLRQLTIVVFDRLDSEVALNSVAIPLPSIQISHSHEKPHAHMAESKEVNLSLVAQSSCSSVFSLPVASSILFNCLQSAPCRIATRQSSYSIVGTPPCAAAGCNKPVTVGASRQCSRCHPNISTPERRCTDGNLAPD